MQIKKDQDKLDRVSKRFRELREKNELSIKELREMIEENEDVSFSPSAYCRWENAQRMPSRNVIKALSNYYGVSEDWLSGESDSMGSTIRGFESNQTSDIKIKNIPNEELYLHRGEPIWTPYGGGKWALVHQVEDFVLFANGEKIPFYEIQIKFFRVPIAYYYPVDSSMDPISLKNLNKYEKVWIEPITREFSDRQKFKGWGNQSADTNCFINPITNISYKLGEYGVTWIAYEDVI